MHTTSASLLSRVRDPADEAAWHEFDARYRSLIVRFCLRRGLPEADADDVAQRVLMNLSRSLQHFIYDPARGKFRDYLFRCTRNVITEWAAHPIRRVGPLIPASDELCAENSPDPAVAKEWEDEWVAHHYRRALAAVRETFDARSISVFDRCMAGDSVAEVARAFNMTEGSVYKLRTRIRERLQELVARQVEEEDRV